MICCRFVIQQIHKKFTTFPNVVDFESLADRYFNHFGTQYDNFDVLTKLLDVINCGVKHYQKINKI